MAPLFNSAFILAILGTSTYAFTIAPLSQQHKSLLILQNEPSPAEEGEKEVDTGLLLGDEVLKNIQALGTDNGYLEAAKIRNAEGKKKLLEQAAREEREAAERLKKREEAAAAAAAAAEAGDDYAEGNAGPGDMSTFAGFADDGYEASEESSEGWNTGEIAVPDENAAGNDAASKEEPSLLLFDDNKDGEEGKLIL